MAPTPFKAEMAEERRRLEAANEAWSVWWHQTGRREARCILMTAWDPINIGDAPQTWSGYDAYTPGIVNRLRDSGDRDAAVREVSGYLDHVERDWIGTFREGQELRNHGLAHKLVAWHHWSFVCHGQDPRNCAYPRS
jgi:hypothetical protein